MATQQQYRMEKLDELQSIFKQKQELDLEIDRLTKLAKGVLNGDKRIETHLNFINIEAGDKRVEELSTKIDREISQMLGRQTSTIPTFFGKPIFGSMEDFCGEPKTKLDPSQLSSIDFTLDEDETIRYIELLVNSKKRKLEMLVYSINNLINEMKIC